LENDGRKLPTFIYHLLANNEIPANNMHVIPIPGAQRHASYVSYVIIRSDAGLRACMRTID
jgi:hypothetical protein